MYLLTNTQVLKMNRGAPVVAQWVANPASVDKDAGSIPGFARWVEDPALS